MHIKYKNNLLKSAVCRLRFPAQILKNRLMNKSSPVFVVLVVNSRCNLKCSYCFGKYSSKNHREFTTDELVSIIDGFHAMGTRYMLVHGGESLLRDDVGFIIDYIKDKNMYAGLVTNGFLFGKRVDALRNADVICVSLDGSEENNDRNRGKGSYATAINAIRLAKRNKFKLRVQATLTRHTMGDIGFMANLAREVGFFLEFSLLYKADELPRDIVMTDEEIKGALKSIIDYKKKGYPIFPSFAVLNNALFWPFAYDKPRLNEAELRGHKKLIPCRYSRNKVIMDSDGCVYPCFMQNGEFKALSVREAGVKEACGHAMGNSSCSACCYITDNEYNLLFSLSPSYILELAALNIKELFGGY